MSLEAPTHGRTILQRLTSFQRWQRRTLTDPFSRGRTVPVLRRCSSTVSSLQYTKLILELSHLRFRIGAEFEVGNGLLKNRPHLSLSMFYPYMKKKNQLGLAQTNLLLERDKKEWNKVKSLLGRLPLHRLLISSIKHQTLGALLIESLTSYKPNLWFENS